MKKLTLILGMLGIITFSACGPSAEEKAKEQAKQDSIAAAVEQAKLDSIAAVEAAAAQEAAAAAEAAKADSIAKAEAEAATKKGKKK